MRRRPSVRCPAIQIQTSFEHITRIEFKRCPSKVPICPTGRYVAISSSIEACWLSVIGSKVESLLGREDFQRFRRQGKLDEHIHTD